MVITSIAQLRKIIKPLGFNVKVKTFGFGKSATFYKGDEKCPSIFTEDSIKEWAPLFDLLTLCLLDLDEKVYGLKAYVNI